MKLSTLVSLCIIGLTTYAAADEVPRNSRLTFDSGSKVDSCDLSTIRSLPDNIKPHYYKVYLLPDLDSKSFKGNVSINAEVSKESLGFGGPHDIYLHLDESVDITHLSVNFMNRNNQVISVCKDAKSQLLNIKVQHHLRTDQLVKLDIGFASKIRTDRKGIYEVEEDGEHYLRSSLVDGGIRYVFPSFDEPKFKNSYVDLKIATDRKYVVRASTGKTRGGLDFRQNLNYQYFKRTEQIPVNELEFIVGTEELLAKHKDIPRQLPEFDTDKLEAFGERIRIPFSLGR